MTQQADTPKGRSRVAQAWALIQLLDLNEPVSLGGQEAARFSLIDDQGFAAETPEEAYCLFDMGTGQSFLPQLDANWFEQLMTRFRVAVRWNEAAETWEAEVRGRGPVASGEVDALSVIRQAATPADAVVDVLVAACEAGRPPKKYPFSEVTP